MRTVRVHGLSLLATEAQLVTVEARFEPGDKGRTELVLSGLPDAVVRESRARLVSALEENRLHLAPGRLHLHLAPAGTRKGGGGLDLPLAVAAVAALGHVRQRRLERALFLGELGIDGRLQAVPGGIAAADLARREGLAPVVAPAGTADEAAALPGSRALRADDLGEVVRWIATGEGLARAAPPPRTGRDRRRVEEGLASLDALRGVGTAKRALEVAAAGGHALLLFGPPGTGKSRLARALLGLLPPPTAPERLALSRVASAAGRWPGELVRERPFRAPHHTSSFAGLIGGGSPPRPGEVSLAHGGVLFLDELPEFRREALEALRQPLEEERVRIARVGRVLDQPAGFQLVCAMNPCPCGYRGHPRVPCRCSPHDVARYRRRLSGPLLDRLDLRVEVPVPAPHEVVARGPGEDSARVRRARVLGAARIARARGRATARLEGRDLERWAPLAGPARRLLEGAAERHALSARALTSVRRTARTLADLDGGGPLEEAHVAEALGLRASLAP